MADRVAAPAARRAVLAAGLAGARLRRDRGGDPQRRWLDGRVRRRGVPDAGALHRPDRGRSSATGSTPGPTSPRPGPNLDELHELVRFFDRWLQGDPERRRRRAGDRLVRARVRRAGAVPGVTGPGGGGRRRPTRIPPSRRAPGGSPVAPLPLVGTLLTGTRRRGGRTAGIGRLSPPADGRDARRAVVGRRRTAQRPGPRPPARRGARPDLHLRAARERPRDPRRPGGRPPPGGLGAGRDGRRPADRRRPGRHVGPGQRRDPQPDPSPLARRSRAARSRARRGGPRPAAPAGYRFLAGHRIRVSVASSAWPVVWPSPYPATFELHRGGATPSRLVLPVIPPAGGPGDSPVPAFKTTPPDAAGIRRRRRRGRAGLADHGGRHRRDRDGHRPRRRRGRPRGRPPALRGRDADDDRLGRRPGAARASTPTSSTAGTSTPSRPRSAHDRPDQRRRGLPPAVELEVDLDGEPFFRRDWQRDDPAPARLTPRRPGRRLDCGP